MLLTRCLIIYCCFFVFGCANLLKDTDEKVLKEVQLNDEFDQMVKIEKQPKDKKVEIKSKTLPEKTATSKTKSATTKAVKKKIPKKKTPKKIEKKELKGKKMEDKDIKLDSVEDNTGFNGRRPNNDPFRVGEKVVLDLSYFSMSAGKLTMEVLPFSEVNGNKTYTFRISVKSSKMFSLFYKVDNWAETYVDYNDMIPYSHVVQTRETNQIKDAKSFFNWETKEAIFWEKKLKDKSKEPEVEKSTWDLKPYAQNVISSIFYIRTFAYEGSKTYPFRVADEGKNIIFTSQVVSRETLKTKAGSFKTIKIKPKFTVNGTFKPVGDIFLWLTDDDRKMLVRIEAKIKIGSIVGEAEKVKLGKE